MRTVFYYLALACLFTHELDAVAHSEWRLLFVLQRLPDATALPWFVVLHVPLLCRRSVGHGTAVRPWRKGASSSDRAPMQAGEVSERVKLALRAAKR